MNFTTKSNIYRELISASKFNLQVPVSFHASNELSSCVARITAGTHRITLAEFCNPSPEQQAYCQGLMLDLSKFHKLHNKEIGQALKVKKMKEANEMLKAEGDKRFIPPQPGGVEYSDGSIRLRR